jgi:DNA-binding transcriptional LysR family regulator
VAQPALSQRIHALEREFGVTLLLRSARGVTTTTAGAALYERARDLLARVGAIEELMNGYHPEADRRARLGVPVGVPAELLDGIVTAFHERHPGLDLRLVDLTTEEQVVALRTRAIDVGLVREPVGAALRLRPVLVEPFGIVVRNDDPLAARDAVGLVDLADRPLIWWSRRQAPGFHDAITATCSAAGFTPNVVCEATDVVGALGRVAAGYGLHWMPEPAFHRYAQGLPRLVWRPLHGNPIAMRTSAAWLRDTAPNAATTTLLDVIAEVRTVH